MAPHPDDILEALAQAGKAKSDADRARADAMLDIATWIERGVEASIDVTRLANAAGIDRKTAYRMLGADY